MIFRPVSRMVANCCVREQYGNSATKLRASDKKVSLAITTTLLRI